MIFFVILRTDIQVTMDKVTIVNKFFFFSSNDYSIVIYCKGVKGFL